LDIGRRTAHRTIAIREPGPAGIGDTARSRSNTASRPSRARSRTLHKCFRRAAARRFCFENCWPLTADTSGARGCRPAAWGPRASPVRGGCSLSLIHISFEVTYVGLWQIERVAADSKFNAGNIGRSEHDDIKSISGPRRRGAQAPPENLRRCVWWQNGYRRRRCGRRCLRRCCRDAGKRRRNLSAADGDERAGGE